MSEQILAERFTNPAKPLICLEVNPPRGTEVEPIIRRLENQLSGIDFLNVTDCALARMRLAALPFGALLKQRLGLEPLVNLSCRDRNLIAIQADLLAGWVLGVRSLVALTGDAVSVGDEPDRKGVFEVNSLGLLGAISTLNAGKDLAGNDLKGRPEFVAGAVVNPNANNTAAELKRLRRKKEAGAVYALSQPVFEEQSAREFFSAAKEVGLPILMGLMALKTARALDGIVKGPGIKVADSIKKKVSESGDSHISRVSIEHCLKLAKANKQLVCGFHVISGTTPLLALELAQELTRS
ncbi:MAG: hypothetical protein DCC75_12185 [Proteobacteria bacterium]|nr:MAG: hypothetical protein DCC75_12185 [Pseudomonadota bacterium]